MVVVGRLVHDSPKKDILLPPAKPFYATIELWRFVLVAELVTQAISLWFLSIATLRISSFPADSLYYLSHLPIAYWWGLAASVGLLAVRGFFGGRLRTAFEIGVLFLLALYAFGVPSFSYQNPRVLDSYLHESGALAVINNNGWFGAPVWYVRQFPGAFTFLAQLSSVAGIGPFSIMQYYPIIISWLTILFAYAIARMYSPRYCAISSALLIGGLWFQLHDSPQSLELLPYLGMIFVILKVLEDPQRRWLWILIGVAAMPSFVVSHPETPLVMGLAILVFFLLSLLKSRWSLKIAVLALGPILLTLVAWTAYWWGLVAVEARVLVQTQFIEKAFLSFSHAQTTAVSIPVSPAPSYHVTLLLDQAISVTIWILGFGVLAFFKRFFSRERVLAGFFLAGVATIPVALFGPPDVLQRSYLFSLIPAVFLFAWVLERERVLSIRGRSLSRIFKAALILAMIILLVLIPITRNGVDPFQYLPQSSLSTSDVGASLKENSVLVLPLGDYALRLYSGIDKNNREVRGELSNITRVPGVFIKGNLTLQADESSDYMILSDYYNNLYSLKYGQSAGYYVNQTKTFETLVSLRFNLVYSTGSDRIYANPNLS